MSEGKLRTAEKKGFNFTCWEKNVGKSGVKTWLCKSPGFISIVKSPCGLGSSQEDAYDDCLVHMKEKKINSKVQPKKAGAKDPK